jgi:hypothetical protein
MQRLPLSVQNAYSDLLDRLQDDVVLEIGGKPVQRTIRGRRYWYGRNYVGNEERERYLGADRPELRARIERLQEEMSGLRAREKSRRPLVQMLRVRGVPPIDATTGKVVQALARAGVFRLRGVLVGTQAFRLYPLILGVAIPEAHHATEDIDLAQFHEISVALDDKADPKVREALAQVGELTPRASLYPAQPTGYRVADALVEILTPNRGPDRDEPIELPALGVYAKPLRFLDFLLAEAIPAAVPYRYGVLVNVPPPARYAVHKLIIATRRARPPGLTEGSAAKARKDVEQAMALIRVLAEDQPDELARAYQEAGSRGEQWRRALSDGTNRLTGDVRQMLDRALAESEADA